MRALGEIAQFIGGEMRGDGSLCGERVVPAELVKGATDLALILSPKEVSVLSSGKIANAVVSVAIENLPTLNQIVVRQPRLVLAKLTALFERPVHLAPGIHPWTVIDPTASIGQNVSIGPFCHIGPNSRIGDRCRLVSNIKDRKSVV